MEHPSVFPLRAAKLQTAFGYYDPLATLKTSQPLTQLGYRNPVPIARRRIQTTGWLAGEGIAMPEYPYNGRVVTDERPIEYRGW